MKSKIFLGIFKEPVDYIKFSGGEIQISLSEVHRNFLVSKELKGQINITAHVKCSEGIILLSQLKNLIDNLNLKEKIVLYLPYVPYARYDRIMLNPDSFSLEVFANLLNSLNFDEVIVQDCHSEVTTNLINNCFNVDQATLIKDSFDFSNYNLIVAPDKGSIFKAAKIAKLFNKELIICDKTRDETTGKLSRNFKILSRIDTIINSRVLIVDDICDGGGTFLGLGQELLKYNPDYISLYVTHGIFSKGLDDLNKIFDNIYAYNCWVETDCINYKTDF